MHYCKTSVPSQAAKLSCIIVAIVLAGCTTPSYHSTVLKLGKDDAAPLAVDLPAERRAAWVITKNNKTIVCAEPPTDVGVDVKQLLSIAADAKRGDVGGGASLDASIISNMVELKGRTPAVLALRDVMYRMCEARMNGVVFDAKKEIDIYESVVRIIESFAEADLHSAQAKADVAAGREAGDMALARAKASEGFQALQDKKWEDARKAFAASEKAFPTYGWSYEYSRALKAEENKTYPDKYFAQKILDLKGHLPQPVRDVLKEIVEKNDDSSQGAKK